MGPPDTHAGFNTTRWTLIVLARDNRDAMGQLLELYWSPVYAYLRRSGLNRQDAADMTQEFLTERVLDGELLKQADQERGRFRCFLLRAVKNLLIDRVRRDRARLRHAVRWTEEMLDAAEPRDEDDPATAFDRQYAATVVSRAVQSLETECSERGMNRQWTVFDERVVRKARGGEPTAIDDLAARVNAQTPQVVYSINQTMNRKFQAAFDDVIAQTVDADEDVADERAAILRSLGIDG